MNMVLKHEIKASKYLCLRQDKNGVYTVILSDSCRTNTEVYRTEKQYSTSDKKKAYNTFSRYRREL